MAIETAYAVDGLTCAHCASAVREELGGLPGVRDTHVELVEGGTSTVTVESDAALSNESISLALSEAGDYVLAGRTR